MKPVSLYKLSLTNLLSWSISTTDNKVVIEHGVFRGKKQVDIHACATAADAETEALRRIAVKKTKQGYTEEIPSSVPDLPMLASNYNPSLLPDKVFIQPKLDGIRCVGSNIGMRTRRNEPITSLPHITKLLSTLPPGVKLDGELYCHGMSFQEHLSIVKRDSPHAKCSEMQFHVFDLQVESMPYSGRLGLLLEHVKNLSSQLVVPVQTHLVNTNEIETIARAFFRDYEGAILRDPNGEYLKNHRSHFLQKYKWSYHAECQIVNIIAPTTGRSEGAAIFVCRFPDTGQQFKAVPALPIYIRKSIYQDRENFIGYWARVKYDGLSIKGVPLKPRAEAYSYRAEDLQ